MQDKRSAHLNQSENACKHRKDQTLRRAYKRRPPQPILTFLDIDYNATISIKAKTIGRKGGQTGSEK